MTAGGADWGQFRIFGVTYELIPERDQARLYRLNGSTLGPDQGRVLVKKFGLAFDPHNVLKAARQDALAHGATDKR